MKAPTCEHEKMHSCGNYRFIDDLTDYCKHYNSLFSLDAPDSREYDPLWNYCKDCKYWFNKKKKHK